MRFTETLRLGSMLLVALLAAATTAGAAETKRIGNTDGKPFSAACPAGTAIIGFAYNSSNQLTAIVPFCQPIDSDGHPSGTVPKLGKMKGVAVGSEGKPVMCTDGMAVNRLDVTMNENSGISSFRPTCRGPGHAPAIMKSTDVAAVSTGSRGVADCGTGQVAVAVVGTYKDTGARQGILSIGLDCAAPGHPSDSAKADDEAKPEDEGDEPVADEGNGGDDEANANGGDDGGGDFANGPVAARTNTPSMIYAKPGKGEKQDLEEGARVSVIECDEQVEDWCEVSKPVKGWVWKPELDF